MKRKNPIAIFAGWLALALAPFNGAHAVEVGLPDGGGQAAAALSGRVQNVATGQYLNNARLSIRGTNLVTFTDQTGTYHFAQIPTGAIVLEAAYTGLDAQHIALQVSAGQTLVQHIDLTSVARYGEGVVKLDAFTVTSSRETDGRTIAINEQRYAPNVKNVVTADSVGDVVDGNVGEFLKYVPGVMGDFDTDEAASTIATVSIRGFSSNLTGVSSDGAQLANTSNATGTSRSFSFGQVSINNVSRIELTKVPTPSTPADSLAGSVNMVSKSAFERRAAEFRYRLSLSGDSDALTLRKSPYPSEKRIFKMLPGADFDYTLPLTKDFGLVLTGLSTRRFIDQYSEQMIYNAAGTGTGASFAKPYLQSYRIANIPRVTTRESLALRLDWRPAPSSVLSFVGQAGQYESHKITNLWLFSAGTVGTPTPATGVPLTFGDNFTSGATGRGSVTMGTAASSANPMATTSGNLRYRFDNGNWKIDASLSESLSKGGYRDTSEGHFRQFGLALKNPVRVAFSDVGPTQPGGIQVLDNGGQAVDVYNINNYVLTTANSTPRDISDKFDAGSLDLRKNLTRFPVPASLQIGGQQRQQTRDVKRQSITWTYNGPGGNQSPAPYLTDVYTNQDNHFGYRNLPWVSHYKAWDAFQSNPALFTKTPAQIVAEENFRRSNSEYLSEKVSAWYFQAEARLFQNKLHVLTGVRYEKTDVEGQGLLYDPSAVYVRNADGTFARNAAGQRIRKTEAGAVGSIEELRLLRTERGFRATRTYDGYYPSLHLTYSLKENLLLRAAYAKTYGRPDFADVVPNSTIDESDVGQTADPNAIRGRITVRNTGLRPWSADNYDLSLEYYTKQGGLISAGVFLKKIKDFFGDYNQVATAGDLESLGLDPRYVGWQLTTKINAGDAEVAGAEANFTHSLAPLGSWGKYFDFFANGTLLNLKGNQEADFNNFVSRSASWGLTARRKPVTLTAKWNYRGQQRRLGVPALGPDGYEYQGRRLIMDANLDYQFRGRLAFFLNVQNVFKEPLYAYRYSSVSPDYAKRPYLITINGVQFTAGLKGTF